MKKYAVIGFGCAGFSAATNLRQLDPEACIDVYSNTEDAPANPMLTTYYVAGKISRDEVFPFGKKNEIVRELDIRLIENNPVKHVHAGERTVVLADGTKETYDDIVLATGSHPLVPAIQGMPEEGIYVMRTVYDADRLLQKIQSGVKSALVIGASWVGIKVVEALYAHHVPEITLADLATRIFPTATLPDVAEKIHNLLEEKGISLFLGKGLSAFHKEKDGIVARFNDGSEIKADVVVLCLGLRPTVNYLDGNEIAIGRGIQVDRHQRTSVQHVYAAGDCCEAEEIVSGKKMVVNLWANAGMQGRVAARNICGWDDEFQGNFIHNITHFLDMDFIGIGDNRAEGERISFASPEGWSFDMTLRDGVPACVNILENNRLSGPAKAALLKRINSPQSNMGLDAVLALKRAGLPDDIIDRIKGECHDNR